MSEVKRNLIVAGCLSGLACFCFIFFFSLMVAGLHCVATESCNRSVNDVAMVVFGTIGVYICLFCLLFAGIALCVTVGDHIKEARHNERAQKGMEQRNESKEKTTTTAAEEEEEQSD